MKTVVLRSELATELFDPFADVSAIPFVYLHANQLDLCESVNGMVQAHALERDAGWVARKRGGYADTWRARHDPGCEIIAAALVKDRIPVF